MNRLSPEKRQQVIASLVEGNSIRATVRMTGVAKNTVTKLLTDMGVVCSGLMDREMRDLQCERVQVDEIWAFVGCKEKNVPDERRGEFGIGDVWTWVAIDADTKLVPSYLVGSRDLGDARRFMDDLRKRLASRVQLTTDGHRPYLQAVRGAFKDDVDYAMLVKLYGTEPKVSQSARYSPGVCIGAERHVVSGNPDKKHISTVLRRAAEPDDAHVDAAVHAADQRLLKEGREPGRRCVAALRLLQRFVRVHKTLGTTPAVAAGITDRVWTLADLIALLEEAESVPVKRGRYAKTRERVNREALSD
jgi:transposase-like protein